MLKHEKINDTADFFLCYLPPQDPDKCVFTQCAGRKKKQSLWNGCSQQLELVCFHHLVNNSNCSHIWNNMDARSFISTFYGSLITKLFQTFDGQDALILSSNATI